jgi:hypothetical protein
MDNIKLALTVNQIVKVKELVSSTKQKILLMKLIISLTT